MITIFPFASRDNCRSNVSPFIIFFRPLQETGLGLVSTLHSFALKLNGVNGFLLLRVILLLLVLYLST